MLRIVATTAPLLAVTLLCCAAPQPPVSSGERGMRNAGALAVASAGCVRDPLADAADRILARHASEVAEMLGHAPTLADVTDPHCFGRHATVDLDGDGVDDEEVTEHCSYGTYAALHQLYFSNRGCRVFAGEIVDGELHPAPRQTRGVQDIEAQWSNGCAGNDYVWSSYRWNGKEYERADQATCQLCEENVRPLPADANLHPHCRADLAARRAAPGSR